MQDNTKIKIKRKLFKRNTEDNWLELNIDSASIKPTFKEVNHIKTCLTREYTNNWIRIFRLPLKRKIITSLEIASPIGRKKKTLPGSEAPRLSVEKGYISVVGQISSEAI